MIPSKPTQNTASRKNRKLSPELESQRRRLRAIWDRRKAEKRISQTTFGIDAGMTQSAVSKYLGGKIPLNPRIILEFSAYLGCQPQDIDPDFDWQLIHTGRDQSYRAASLRIREAVDALLSGLRSGDISEDQFVTAVQLLRLRRPPRH